MRWLVSQAHWIPLDLRLPFLVRLARVTHAGPHAGAVRAAAETATRVPRADLAPALARLRARPSHRGLERVLNELWRRALLGEPAAEAHAELAAWLAEAEPGLWRGLLPIQQLVMLRRLERLALPASRRPEDVRAELRSAIRAVGEEASFEHANTMFGLTHVFLTASDDFERHVDAAAGGLEPEVALLRRAERHYAVDAPVFRGALDLRAEIATALALARVPEDAARRDTLAWLVARQNEDGSWDRVEGGSLRRRAHATFAVTVALLGLPARLPGDPGS